MLSLVRVGAALLLVYPAACLPVLAPSDVAKDSAGNVQDEALREIIRDGLAELSLQVATDMLVKDVIAGVDVTKASSADSEEVQALSSSKYGAGWGNFKNYEKRSLKLMSSELKKSPTGICSKSKFSKAECGPPSRVVAKASTEGDEAIDETSAKMVDGLIGLMGQVAGILMVQDVEKGIDPANPPASTDVTEASAADSEEVQALSGYGAGWGNFKNYEKRSLKLMSSELKKSPTGICSKSKFSKAECP